MNTRLNQVYIRRLAESRMVQILAGSKIGIVLGARQVGKTTLVEQVTSLHRAAGAVFRQCLWRQARTDLRRESFHWAMRRLPL